MTPICSLCHSVAQNPVQWLRPMVSKDGLRWYAREIGCLQCVNFVLETEKALPAFVYFFTNNPNFVCVPQGGVD